MRRNRSRSRASSSAYAGNTPSRKSFRLTPPETYPSTTTSKDCRCRGVVEQLSNLPPTPSSASKKTSHSATHRRRQNSSKSSASKGSPSPSRTSTVTAQFSSRSSIARRATFASDNERKTSRHSSAVTYAFGFPHRRCISAARASVFAGPNARTFCPGKTFGKCSEHRGADVTSLSLAADVVVVVDDASSSSSSSSSSSPSSSSSSSPKKYPPPLALRLRDRRRRRRRRLASAAASAVSPLAVPALDSLPSRPEAPPPSLVPPLIRYFSAPSPP